MQANESTHSNHWKESSCYFSPEQPLPDVHVVSSCTLHLRGSALHFCRGKRFCLFQRHKSHKLFLQFAIILWIPPIHRPWLASASSTHSGPSSSYSSGSTSHSYVSLTLPPCANHVEETSWHPTTTRQRPNALDVCEIITCRDAALLRRPAEHESLQPNLESSNRHRLCYTSFWLIQMLSLPRHFLLKSTGCTPAT